MVVEEQECVECQTSRLEAETRASAKPLGDGLQLGDCRPVYREWVECNERAQGQASSCSEVLKRFRDCHRSLVSQ